MKPTAPTFDIDYRSPELNGQIVYTVVFVDDAGRDVYQTRFDISDATTRRVFSEKAAVAVGYPALAGTFEQLIRTRAEESRTPTGIQPVLLRACEVELKRMEWLWPSKLALGKINLFCGDPGSNKSTLSLDIAARVTRGVDNPDGTPCSHGSAIIVSAEDDACDTVVPRLMAAGADLKKIIFLNGVSVPTEDGKRQVVNFTLEQIPTLQDAIHRVQDCKLVIIDPVSAYLSDRNSHKNAEVRALLSPLAKLAADCRVCIVIVTHLNKGGGGGAKAMYRAMDSLAFIAASRSGWLIAKEKGNDRRRLFLPIKNNIGNDTEGHAFNVISEIVNGDSHPRVEWETMPIRTSADEVLGADQEPAGRESAARDAAEDWLRDLLSAGPMQSAKIKDEADAAGMAWRTIRRAQQAIGIKPLKDRWNGAWMWKLPFEPTTESNLSTNLANSPTNGRDGQHGQHGHLPNIDSKIESLKNGADEDAEDVHLARTPPRACARACGPPMSSLDGKKLVKVIVGLFPVQLTQELVTLLRKQLAPLSFEQADGFINSYRVHNPRIDVTAFLAACQEVFPGMKQEP